ncbi:dethiobiotin synthase [Sphingobium subterraneum]|uniref:ATP-dependent dethiobiotin synthetase BioD n=1 Tax=Sphingobium subterraneum TaxID=627688 RepID=A0A841J4L4_9SPHN|nr:dethiobiotin synthase [Sphingobium subterraneum]MBB6124456.1 dethiobiotin synthetase [Sphingobium subterraneum]
MTKGVLCVTGTDTDVGKTVVSAAIAASLPGALYWKPVQAGRDPMTDSERVAQWGAVPAERILPEAYNLSTPASPHLAAFFDEVRIDPEHLYLPKVSGPLVVEGAGGVLVPLSETFLQVEMFAQWQAPVLLVARTGLGTINHSLLSIEALRARRVPVAGILFSGEAHAENERVIPRIADVRSFGRLPLLDRIDGASLVAAARDHIDIAGLAQVIGVEAG